MAKLVVMAMVLIVSHDDGDAGCYLYVNAFIVYGVSLKTHSDRDAGCYLYIIFYDV